MSFAMSLLSCLLLVFSFKAGNMDLFLFFNNWRRMIYCLYFCCSSENDDVLTVLTRVNREVGKGVYASSKQMPEPRYTLTKKLAFRFVWAARKQRTRPTNVKQTEMFTECVSADGNILKFVFLLWTHMSRGLCKRKWVDTFIMQNKNCKKKIFD